jgi:hypothetical protein
MRLLVPSIYWPIARLGFSRNRRLRRVFRLLFSNLYRKRFWNPTMNSWAKNRGFDQRRHTFAGNTHAICSTLVLAEIVFFLWAAHHTAAAGRSFPPDSEFALAMARGASSSYRWVVGLSIFELVFNVPAIILTRYLCLLTVRRPGIVAVTLPASWT